MKHEASTKMPESNRLDAWAVTINDDGQVVGVSCNGSNVRCRGIAYQMEAGNPIVNLTIETNNFRLKMAEAK